MAKFKTTPNSGNTNSVPNEGEGLHQRKGPTAGAKTGAKPEPHEPDFNNEQLEIVKKIRKYVEFRDLHKNVPNKKIIV